MDEVELNVGLKIRFGPEDRSGGARLFPGAATLEIIYSRPSGIDLRALAEDLNATADGRHFAGGAGLVCLLRVGEFKLLAPDRKEVGCFLEISGELLPMRFVCNLHAPDVRFAAPENVRCFGWLEFAHVKFKGSALGGITVLGQSKR